MAKDTYFVDAFNEAMAAGEVSYASTLLDMKSISDKDPERANVINTLRHVDNFERALELCATLRRDMPQFAPYRRAALAMVDTIAEKLEKARDSRPETPPQP